LNFLELFFCIRWEEGEKDVYDVLPARCIDAGERDILTVTNDELVKASFEGVFYDATIIAQGLNHCSVRILLCECLA